MLVLMNLRSRLVILKFASWWNYSPMFVFSNFIFTCMQNDILKKEIEAQNKQKDNLVGRANEAEEKIQELNLKLENVCWSIVICFCITYSIVE